MLKDHRTTENPYSIYKGAPMHTWHLGTPGSTGNIGSAERNYKEAEPEAVISPWQ